MSSYRVNLLFAILLLCYENTGKFNRIELNWIVRNGRTFIKAICNICPSSRNMASRRCDNKTTPLRLPAGCFVSRRISWEQDKGGKNALENKAVSEGRGLSSDIASRLLISTCRLDQPGQTDARPSPLQSPLLHSQSIKIHLWLLWHYILDLDRLAMMTWLYTYNKSGIYRQTLPSVAPWGLKLKAKRELV